jgi:hypothetical protein
VVGKQDENRHAREKDQKNEGGFEIHNAFVSGQLSVVSCQWSVVGCWSIRSTTDN